MRFLEFSHMKSDSLKGKQFLSHAISENIFKVVEIGTNYVFSRLPNNVTKKNAKTDVPNRATKQRRMEELP